MSPLLFVALAGFLVTVSCVTAIAVLHRNDRRMAEAELREARRYRSEETP